MIRFAIEVVALWIVWNLGGYEARENVRAISAALKWWASEGDFNRYVFDSGEVELCWPRWLLRAAYTIKAITCVLIGRHAWLDYGDTIEVGAWNFRPLVGEYSGTSWTELRVGRGFFRGWSYHHNEDQSA